VIEVAARLGGGHDAELCELALGIDLNGLAIDTALGRQVDEASLRGDARVGGACVRFLVAPEGTLEAVGGLEEAGAVPGVTDVRVYRARGHVFGPLRRGSDRAGAVLAVGESRDDALASAELAASEIVFSVH
jgi:biotin carboxylase